MIRSEILNSAIRLFEVEITPLFLFDLQVRIRLFPKVALRCLQHLAAQTHFVFERLIKQLEIILVVKYVALTWNILRTYRVTYRLRS